MKIVASVAAYKIHLDNKCAIIICDPNVPSAKLPSRNLDSSRAFSCIRIGWDWSKWVSLKTEKVQHFYTQSHKSSIPWDTDFPAHFVLSHGWTEYAFLKSRMRFVSPANNEVFCFILLCLGDQCLPGRAGRPETEASTVLSVTILCVCVYTGTEMSLKKSDWASSYVRHVVLTNTSSCWVLSRWA